MRRVSSLQAGEAQMLVAFLLYQCDTNSVRSNWDLVLPCANTAMHGVLETGSSRVGCRRWGVADRAPCLVLSIHIVLGPAVSSTATKTASDETEHFLGKIANCTNFVQSFTNLHTRALVCIWMCQSAAFWRYVHSHKSCFVSQIEHSDPAKSPLGRIYRALQPLNWRKKRQRKTRWKNELNNFPRS